MASLPYPLCHDCPADLVGMAMKKTDKGLYATMNRWRIDP